MDIHIYNEPTEAWIILYYTYDRNSWYGSFPSTPDQWYYTDWTNGTPIHFDTFDKALEVAESLCIPNYIIVPVAGIAAERIRIDQQKYLREKTKEPGEDLPF
jgi:hypothetical protein